MRFFVLALMSVMMAGCGGSSQDKVTPNLVPKVTVVASHQIAMVGDRVTLKANVVDENISTLSYQWQQTKGQSLTIASPHLASLSFLVPKVIEEHRVSFSVVVTDSKGLSASEVVSVLLKPNQLVKPTVYPLSDNLVLMANDAVSLLVSADDPDGEITGYQWQQVSGPELQFSDQGENTLRVNVPEINHYQSAEFLVTVYDNDNLSATTTLTLDLFPHFEVTQLQGRPDGKGVDLVILGDGFTQDDMVQYQKAVSNFVHQFKTQETISKHIDGWNIHRIDVISKQQGADFPNDNHFVDTAFDAYFQCGDITRLLCINSAKVLGVTAKLIAQFDQVIVVVNSPHYGGAGGQVATFSLADSAADIAIHELGHSFAGLADEYDYGATDDNVYEPNEPNVTTKTNIQEVKWRHWFTDLNGVPTQPGELGVGLFEGAYYHQTDYYRPLDNSIMKELGQPFGPVNAEAWALSVYRTAGVIANPLPAEESVSHPPSTALTFSIEPIMPLQSLNIRWWINDVEQTAMAEQQTSLILNEPVGASYTVTVEVRDQSGLIKQDVYQDAMSRYQWHVVEGE